MHIAKTVKVKQRNNKILTRLAQQDQTERERFFENPDKVTRNDKKRRSAVAALLKEKKVTTSTDYFNAALIFQHGLKIRDYRKAQSLARKSIEHGGGDWSRWLFAVATDRLLTTQGKKQKYGTQFSIVPQVNPKTGKSRRILKILPYDKRTGDATREKHRLPPLSKLLKMDGSPQPRKQRKITADDHK